MKTLTIIVPVYFNSASLEDLFLEFGKLENSLSQRDLKTQFIFVDDGSKDDSLAKLCGFAESRSNATVVKHSRYFGSMAALKSEMNFVEGDAFTFIAADLQEPPSLIIDMVECWLDGAKYVVCTRESRDDPAFTKATSWLYYRTLELLVVDDYPDGGYDLSLMDKVMLPFLKNSGKYTNLLLYAHSLGFKTEQISYQRRKRLYGKSGWSFWRRLGFFVDSILGFSIKPLRYVSALGVIVAIFSFAYAVFVVTQAAFVAQPVPGWASLAAMLSFLLGVVIFMLGVIGEYLWRIFNQVNGSPDAVIDEVY